MTARQNEPGQGIDPALLARINLFGQLDDDERAVLALRMQERQVEPGEILFHTGHVGESMFIVQSGCVELYVRDTAGQKIELHVARAGDYFGELSLLDGGSRTASAEIAEAGTLLVLDREDLLHLFERRPEAALDMLAALGKMTRKADSLLQIRVSRNVNDEVDEEHGGLVMRLADWVANFSGSITFLVIHVVFFACWIVLNLGVLPYGGFDPFPFGLLTMAVSLEAIILSTLLLFRTNRHGLRDRARSDIEYAVNLKAELEVAHLHEKVARMHEEMLHRFNRIERGLQPNGPAG